MWNRVRWKESCLVALLDFFWRWGMAVCFLFVVDHQCVQHHCALKCIHKVMSSVIMTADCEKCCVGLYYCLANFAYIPYIIPIYIHSIHKFKNLMFHIWHTYILYKAMIFCNLFLMAIICEIESVKKYLVLSPF